MMPVPHGLQVIYDPDPNPKNEEQAIARSHRIGQTRQVQNHSRLT